MNFDKATLAWTLPWDADWPTSIAFIGTSRQVAAGNNLGQILLWELPEKPGGDPPKPAAKLNGHTNCVTRLVSTRDGRSLISASYDHTLRVWDMAAPAAGSETVALNVRAIEDLKRRRSSKVPALVEVKVAVRPPARVIEGHREWVTGLVISRDGKRLLSGDDGGAVILRECDSFNEVRRWQVEGWAYGLALSPDNEQAAVGERRPLVFDSGRHAGVKLWDVTTGRAERDLSKTFKDMYIAAAAYSPDGKLLALGRGGEVDGPNGKVFLVNPADGAKVRELSPGHLNGLTDLAFHPDGVHLASCGRDTVVRLWHAADGKLVKELGKPRGGQFKDWLHALSFSADGRWLAAADMAGAVQVWHLGD